jgi:hypothetical protein
MVLSSQSESLTYTQASRALDAFISFKRADEYAAQARAKQILPDYLSAW